MKTKQFFSAASFGLVLDFNYLYCEMRWRNNNRFIKVTLSVIRRAGVVNYSYGFVNLRPKYMCAPSQRNESLPVQLSLEIHQNKRANFSYKRELSRCVGVVYVGPIFKWIQSIKTLGPLYQFRKLNKRIRKHTYLVCV